VPDDVISIKNAETFPAKIEAIRAAAAQLRVATDALSQITDTAEKEASSFTRGVPAPVYDPLQKALAGWVGAIKPAMGMLANNAENGAATAEWKFRGTVDTDVEVANRIAGAGGVLGGGPAPAPIGTKAALPGGVTEINKESPNRHSREEVWNKGYTEKLRDTPGQKPDLIVLHSTETPGSAAALADSMVGEGKSYHSIVDTDGKTVVHTVNPAMASHAVMDPGNGRAINIAMADTYSGNQRTGGNDTTWSTQQWLERDAQLRTTADLAVREAMAAGIPPVVVEMGGGSSGIVSSEWICDNIPLQPGSGWTTADHHRDVGANASYFPWEKFTEYVNAAADRAGYQRP
jgi:hypothetical protein